MPTQELLPCIRCGISGVHACLGVKQKPMSKRAEVDFKQVISIVIKSIKAKRQEGEK